jgi:hypothetical protein
LSKAYIKDYIRNIQQDLEKQAEISRLRQLKLLIDIAYHNKKERTNDRLKAIEIINKMLGYNESSKLDVTSKGEKLNMDLSQLTYEQLCKLAGDNKESGKD